MAEKIPAPPRMDWEKREKLEDAAWEKARDVNFTTRNNPLAYVTPQEAYATNRVEQNYHALHEDANRRKNPTSGMVYAGIMNMRYGG